MPERGHRLLLWRTRVLHSSSRCQLARLYLVGYSGMISSGLSSSSMLTSLYVMTRT